MKLPSDQTDEIAFLRFGQEAVSLLEKREFQLLADRFGYALAFGRSPVVAIEEDFQSCMAKFPASSEQSTAIPASMAIKYFEPNNSNLFAVIECVFTAAKGCPVLAELIVTVLGQDKHICLEQVSHATGPPL